MKHREHNLGSKLLLEKYLEKLVVEYLLDHPKAYMIFNSYTGELLIFDILTLDHRAIKAVYRLKERGCFFEDDKGLSRLSAKGIVEYDNLKDTVWDYPVPQLTEADMKVYKSVGNEWGTCSDFFGGYHYKWWNSLRILTANNLLENKYNGEIYRGNKVYRPPKLELRRNRYPEYFRRIQE